MTTVNIVFISAGNIMFGTPEGPWNHSTRLERKLGQRLRIVAVINPTYEVADEKIAAKKQSGNRVAADAYSETKIFQSLDAYIESGDAKRAKPDAFWIGSPAQFRGGTQPGRDLEQRIMAAFPDAGMFIEKPVSCGPVEEALDVANQLKSHAGAKSVGYMLRYLQVVQKMKSILHENNLKVMATNARYVMAYEYTAKPAWWDKSKDLGPIIEQATHFADLSRYFGGDVLLDSVQATALEYDEPPGQLSKVPVDENAIAYENRIPRVTAANWTYDSGAVGCLMHAVALQGADYQTELDVYADGYSLRLVDPYNNPTLYVRSPESDKEKVYTYEGDDPFYSEVSALIDNLESPGSTPILSTFEDAARTYEFTWAIRKASEASTAQRRARRQESALNQPARS